MTIQIIKPPVMDTYISNRNKCSPSCKNDCKELLVGKKSSNVNRTLIQFDLSSLPLFLTITNCSLHIFLSRNDCPDTSKYLEVFQILSKWTGRKANCTKQPLIASTPLRVTTITDQNDVFVSLNITTLVQNWYTNQSANLGIMLRMRDETADTLIGLCSKEFKDSQFWPYLEVNIKDPASPDKCCKPIDLSLQVVAKGIANYTSALNVLLFDYSYLIVNNGIYPALVHLQVSCDGTHWETQSAVKTIAHGEMVSCVPDTITKYARLCYQAQNNNQHAELTIYIQGRTC